MNLVIEYRVAGLDEVITGSPVAHFGPFESDESAKKWLAQLGAAEESVQYVLAHGDPSGDWDKGCFITPGLADEVIIEAMHKNLPGKQVVPLDDGRYQVVDPTNPNFEGYIGTLGQMVYDFALEALITTKPQGI